MECPFLKNMLFHKGTAVTIHMWNIIFFEFRPNKSEQVLQQQQKQQQQWQQMTMTTQEEDEHK